MGRCCFSFSERKSELWHRDLGRAARGHPGIASEAQPGFCVYINIYLECLPLRGFSRLSAVDLYCRSQMEAG